MDEPIITRVAPRPVQRPERTPSHVEEIITRAQLQPMEYDEPENNPKLSLRWPDYEPRLTLWNKVRLMPYAFQFIYGVTMKNWKTTISGLVGGCAYLVNAVFGLQIPSEAIITLSLFFVGLFSQDAEKTEG